MNITTSFETMPDADLVGASLEGDREAFGQIVRRYQRLLCSVAYSATGRLSESEDLAQEAFVEAWRQLESLREPEKLRAWLCGIVRFKISRLHRSDRQEPVRQAETLDQAEQVPSDEELAADRAMDKEEQAILWKALESVPETYREPLVLYYRENQSVERVASGLDLTEDAVKQRLSRGRKILQEHVLSLVEGALSRSTPGRAFTLGVLAALPAMSASAKAAAVGAVAAPGGLAAKSAGLVPLLASVSGAVSTILSLRAGLDQTRTPRERDAVLKCVIALFFGSLALLGILWILRAVAIQQPESRVALAWISQALVLTFVAGLPAGFIKFLRRMRAVRSQERRRHPELFLDPRDQAGSSASEYRSRWTFLGVPLVHVRFSTPDEGQRPVFAWLAGGDRAYGLLLAWGGCAIAPFSVGVFSVGIFALGAVGMGLVALGTGAVGLISIGSMAAGVRAYGWLSALGWESAQGGGFSIARTVAKGPIAFAEHANDAIAGQMLADPRAATYKLLVLAVIPVLSIVPIALYARAVRARLGRIPASGGSR